VNNLAHLVQSLVYTRFGAFETFLAQVDGIGEEAAAFLDTFGVTAVFQLDAAVFEELADIVVDFVLLDRFHKQLQCDIRKLGVCLQLQRQTEIIAVKKEIDGGHS